MTTVRCWPPSRRSPARCSRPRWRAPTASCCRSRVARTSGLFEINEAASLVSDAAHADANIIFGAVIDDALGDEVRVTVIAAGFDSGRPSSRKDTVRGRPAPASRRASPSRPGLPPYRRPMAPSGAQAGSGSGSSPQAHRQPAPAAAGLAAAAAPTARGSAPAGASSPAVGQRRRHHRSAAAADPGPGRAVAVRCPTRTSRKSWTSRSSSSSSEPSHPCRHADGMSELRPGRSAGDPTPQGRHRPAGRPVCVPVRLVQPRRPRRRRPRRRRREPRPGRPRAGRPRGPAGLDEPGARHRRRRRRRPAGRPGARHRRAGHRDAGAGALRPRRRLRADPAGRPGRRRGRRRPRRPRGVRQGVLPAALSAMAEPGGPRAARDGAARPCGLRPRYEVPAAMQADVARVAPGPPSAPARGTTGLDLRAGLAEPAPQGRHPRRRPRPALHRRGPARCSPTAATASPAARPAWSGSSS